MSATTVNGTATGQSQKKGGKQSDVSRKQTASPASGDSRKQQSQAPTQKAWQGSNPTIRGTSSSATTSTPNGTDKSAPKSSQQAQPKSNGDANSEKQAYDRAIYLLNNFVGQQVSITLKNGEQFSGIFSGGSFEGSSKQQYIIKMAKNTRPATGQQVNGHTELPSNYTGEGEDHIMAFDVQDTVELDVKGVDFNASQAKTNGSTASSFRTDTEISGRDAHAPRQRELQRWDAGDDTDIDMSLEGGSSTGWDQFAVNERMYGVQSTYDENLYTTSIDRSNPRYKQHEAEAARLAREIEGSSAANSHVAEERRRDADKADGLDEEEKYSGVRREASQLPRRGVGSYVPPSQRPISNTPGARGAPYDPAIISSSLARPSTEKSAEEPKPASEAQTQTTVPPAEGASEASPVPSTSTNAALKPTETTPEDHIRATTDAFKHFANTEKLRLRQSQENKRVQQRHEKNVKLNDLKKFAANFKLKSRVPDDLVPILAKDHEKQQEIQKRADEAAQEEALRAVERAKQKSAQDSITAASPSTRKEPSPQDQTAERSAAAASHRARVSQNLRGSMMGPQPLGRGGMGGRGMPQFGRPPPPQPLPDNMRMPGGPAVPPMPTVQDAGPLSPGAVKRLNVNAKAFEFRPAASTFTPTGASPSPQRPTSSSKKPVESRSFFAKKPKKETKGESHKSFEPQLDAAKSTELSEEQKKGIAANGGLPQPYRTPPTWGHTEKNVNASFKDGLARPAHTHSQGPSPMQTPGSNMGGPMPHAHQLPPQIHAPQGSGPPQRGHMMPHQHGGYPQPFDMRMGGPQQMYGPNGSVQNSPRYQNAQMASYGGGQMHQMGIPPQFGGQGGMQGYGMSPSMPQRQLQMPQPTGPMMMAGGHPQMPFGQMPPMPQQPYPNRGPQQPQQQFQQMQGQPQQFMNGPPQHQGNGYSPMPPHAQPHNMMPGQQGPPGYQNSPRPGPHMMQQSGSHQGYQPQGQMMQQGYGPPQGHPMAMQGRQYSHGPPGGHGGPGGYHMTPRQQQAMPMMGPQQGISPGRGMDGQEEQK